MAGRHGVYWRQAETGDWLVCRTHGSARVTGTWDYPGVHGVDLACGCTYGFCLDRDGRWIWPGRSA